MKFSFALLSCCAGILVLPFSVSWSQTPEIEKLREKVDQSSGTDKLSALTDLSRQFTFIDPGKTIEYGKMAVALAEELKLPSKKSQPYNHIGFAFIVVSMLDSAQIYLDSALQNALIYNDTNQLGACYSRFGVLYETLGMFDSAIASFQRELVINRQLKKKIHTAKAQENIGTIHMQRGELTSAITYLLDAKKSFEEIGNTSDLAYTYLKLGQIYCETGDFQEAERCFKKGIELAQSAHDKHKTGIGLNGLGILYTKQANYTDAFLVFQQAQETVQDIPDILLKEGILTNLGIAYSTRGEYEKALEYYQKALSMGAHKPSSLAYGISLNSIAEVYLNMKDYPQARVWLTKALNNFTELKAYNHQLIALNSLIQTSNALSDWQQSVTYYKQYIQIKDSLNKHELNTALDSLKVKFHTEETNRENLILKQETELKNKTISLQRTIMISSFLLVVSLILIVIIIVLSRRKIKRINLRLVELSRFKDSMTTFLVHDLKNSLNTIINIDSWRNSDHQAEIIRQSGKQMLHLVTNLLDISKYEDNSMHVIQEDSAITDLIRDACQEVVFVASQKSITIKLIPPYFFRVHVDQDIIQRVFINLLTNAIKYSAQGDTVQIRIRQVSEKHIKITIQDNGKGISPEFHQVIFEKFVQIDPRNSGFIHSTGIGLSFCKMAIELHDGQIGVDSEPGKGAAFWITLPLSEQPPATDLNQTSIDFTPGTGIRSNLQHDDIKRLHPFYPTLKALHIYQVSDVKDILYTIDTGESPGIRWWKSALLQALTECNHVKYNDLIKLIAHD